MCVGGGVLNKLACGINTNFCETSFKTLVYLFEKNMKESNCTFTDIGPMRFASTSIKVMKMETIFKRREVND